MALTQSEYDAIMREYDERRLINEDLLRIRRLEIEEKLPEYKALEQKVSAASIDFFKRQMNGESVSKSDLEAEISSYTKAKSDLLLSAGYPTDYLEPIYDCVDCKDTGYVDGQKCHCLKQAMVKALYPHTNLSSNSENVSFSNFSLDYYSKDLSDDKSGMSSFDYAKNALEYCQDFVKNFNAPGGNILLYGPTGIGKTFLSTCIGKELLSKDYSVLYLSAPQFVDICDRKMKDRTLNSYDDFEMLFDVDVLIIDDLGTEVKNTVTISNLLECVNNRIMRKKSTVISTNYNLKNLEENYNERFVSRIAENYKLLRLTGKDIRTQK